VRRAVSLTSGIIGWGIQGGELPTLHYADIARFPGIGLIGFGMGFRALTNVKNTDRMSDSASVGGPTRGVYPCTGSALISERGWRQRQLKRRAARQARGGDRG
jgi:hypothetical protein